MDGQIEARYFHFPVWHVKSLKVVTTILIIIKKKKAERTEKQLFLALSEN